MGDRGLRRRATIRYSKVILGGGVLLLSLETNSPLPNQEFFSAVRCSPTPQGCSMFVLSTYNWTFVHLEQNVKTKVHRIPGIRILSPKFAVVLPPPPQTTTGVLCLSHASVCKPMAHRIHTPHAWHMCVEVFPLATHVRVG